VTRLFNILFSYIREQMAMSASCQSSAASGAYDSFLHAHDMPCAHVAQAIEAHIRVRAVAFHADDLQVAAKVAGIESTQRQAVAI